MSNCGEPLCAISTDRLTVSVVIDPCFWDVSEGHIKIWYGAGLSASLMLCTAKEVRTTPNSWLARFIQVFSELRKALGQHRYVV